MYVHGEARETRAQRTCVYNARGWAGYTRARSHGHVGHTLLMPRHTQPGQRHRQPSRERRLRHAMDVRVYVEMVSWCRAPPPRGRRRAVGGPPMGTAPTARARACTNQTVHPPTQRHMHTARATSAFCSFTMAYAPRRARPALASAHSLPSISSPPSVQPFKPLPGLGGRRALPTGA